MTDKTLPVRDPATAIIRKVPGKDEPSLALQIIRLTGCYAWIEPNGIINMERPGSAMELIRINGVVIYQQPARLTNNSSLKGRISTD